MKETVVHFHNGRVEKLTNPDKSKLQGDWVVEPDLSKVAGIPPEYWRLVDGEVVPVEGHEPDDGALAVLRRHQDAIAHVGVVEALYADFDRKSETIISYCDTVAKSATDYTNEQCELLSKYYQRIAAELKTDVYFNLKSELGLAKFQRLAALRTSVILFSASLGLFSATLLLLLRHGR